MSQNPPPCEASLETRPTTRPEFDRAFEAMHETKKELQELVLRETLDLATLQQLHARHIESKRIVEESYARSAAARAEKEARRAALRAERRAVAQTMSKAQLLEALGYGSEHSRRQAMKRTRHELIESYASTLPPTC